MVHNKPFTITNMTTADCTRFLIVLDSAVEPNSSAPACIPKINITDTSVPKMKEVEIAHKDIPRAIKPKLIAITDAKMVTTEDAIPTRM